MAAAWVDVLTVACRRKHRIRVVVAVAIVVLCVWSLAFKSPSDNLEVVPRIANVLKGSGVAGGSPLKEHAKAREYPDFDYKEDAKGQKEEALKEESAAARLSRGKGEDGKDEKIESHSDKKQLAIKKRRKTLNGVVVSDNHSEFDVIGSVDVFSSVNQPVDKRYDEFAEDDAKVVPGVGEDGAPVVLAHDEDDLAKKVMAKEAFNIVASDKISLHRRVPDTRDPRCRNVSYDHDLPTASVIIIFTNEAWTPLLRTIWSVLDQTPAEYLKEIILVDDFSDKKHLKGKLERYIQRRFPSKVRLKRLLKRSGLIRARLAGASLATGDVLLFLDSHCECGKNWIQPLLQRIKEEPKAFVVPIIDVIDDKTMEYYHGNGIYFQIGGFTWSGHFNWIDIPAHEDSRRGSPVGPTRTPTMAGGLFAVLKKSFYDLGSYDEEMDVWGGENLEMSFRVWQCGGSVEIIPCSRVGHIFRSFHPYTFPGNKDSHGINTARTVEVWMDDYKRLFYMNRPDLMEASIGNLTNRLRFRQEKQCRSFKWFLDNIFPQKFVLDDPDHVFAFGRLRNPSSAVCFDTLQSDEKEAYEMGLYPCHKFVSSTQFFSLSKRYELRREDSCAELSLFAAPDEDESATDKVRMAPCHGRGEEQAWIHTKAGRIIHKETNKCLQAETGGSEGNGLQLVAVPCKVVDSQIWLFDNYIS